jgi:phage shock protein A
VKAEKAISYQVLLEKQLDNLIVQTTELIEKRSRQAQLAIDTNEDHIAKIALQEKLLAEKKLELYRKQSEAVKNQNTSLIKQLQELKEKYLQLENKKRALIARANVAQSIRDMNTSMVTIDTTSAAKGFARMEDRVLQMEAAADASLRMRQAYGSEDLSSAELTLQEQVEQEFAKLKASESK